MKLLSSFIIFIFPLVFPCVILSSKSYQQLQLPGVVGPESLAFDCNGEGPYVGVSDGRILKWKAANSGWTEFATTAPHRAREICDGSTNTTLEPLCGRPLGIKFNPVTCDLYIADAYFGLMVVGPNGGQAQQLASSAGGIPFRFTNDLDIDPNTGIVYFTDSSIYFQRRQYFMSIATGDKSGRLLKYDPLKNNVTVMYNGLSFPNGVALSNNNSFLLLAESATLKILRFWLQGERTTYTPQLFAEMPRFPDNIKSDSKGEFWIAMNSARGKIESNKKTAFCEETAKPWFLRDPVGVKFDVNGNVVDVLDGNEGNTLNSVSEVLEYGGYLYTGSSVQPYVVVIKA
ncbi:hypothetical protein AB3S75_038120 [Citrus x aurantiifolia]